MSFGTSLILQLIGPTTQLSPLSEALFQAFRLLEANRLVLFGDESFLSKPAWVKYQRDLATTPRQSLMNTTLEFMFQISSYSKQYIPFFTASAGIHG